MADPAEVVLQALGIVAGVLVSFGAVLYGAKVSRSHEFRKEHFAALRPQVMAIRDEVGRLRHTLDGYLDFSMHSPLADFCKTLRRHSVMPDKLTFQHLATLPVFDRNRLLLAIQDAEALLPIREQLARDLSELMRSESYNFDVNLKTNPGGHANVLMLQLVIDPDPESRASLEFRGDSQQTLGIVGSFDIASGSSSDMGYLHPKVWTLLNKAARRLRDQGGHYPGQETTLLHSIHAWRDETTALHQSLETWLVYGIMGDRCDLCKRRL